MIRSQKKWQKKMLYPSFYPTPFSCIRRTLQNWYDSAGGNGNGFVCSLCVIVTLYNDEVDFMNCKAALAPPAGLERLFFKLSAAQCTGVRHLEKIG